LVEEFLEEMSYKTASGRKYLKPDALSALMEYHWPGNVRELKNFIERLVILSNKREIGYEDLPEDFKSLLKRKDYFSSQDQPWFREKDFKSAKQLFEKEFIKRKLLEYGGNISHTAREIGIERAYLQKKIKELGIKEEVKE
jgi:two-component system nitrogen regulation response regulator NtrX